VADRAHAGLPGSKLQRQQPIHPYTVDFVCLSRRLVIEVDGGRHAVEVDADE
jgi:very-short-patch-repair endonuclease